MTTLTEFLLARIAEDEAVALDSFYEGQTWSTEEEAVVSIDQDLEPVLLMDRKRDATHAARWSPARVLAECKAKRAIVEMADEATGLDMQVDSEFRIGPRDEVEEPYLGDAILRALVQPYADHEDFDAGWLV